MTGVSISFAVREISDSTDALVSAGNGIARTLMSESINVSVTYTQVDTRTTHQEDSRLHMAQRLSTGGRRLSHGQE